MDGWLKGLIATACIVVIAGGGYFAISEYQKSQAAERRGLILACKQIIRDLSKGETKDYKGAHIATCINSGYVTEQDFKDAGAGSYVERFRDILKPPA
ncbi:hypothetical protein [Rhizobium rhizogenes]|uniref:hypothetical protein n=1 Tax=Rhizobium rhizogenes TaxID=359 RepID=UPI0015744534|nr:hypothetical protein [Rhizobium rhizogenes]NTG07156.1 hypothetical protein [Rhizobium rhizogenes]